jgi:glycosyltransferase involved in cell wall biosynthesis
LPQRIAIVTTSFPGGAEDPSGHFVRASARALERQGHDVVVVAPRAGGAFGWPGVAARVRERPLRAIEAAAWVARTRTALSRMKADRVVAHWAVPCAWPVGVAAKAELEVVSHGGDVRLLVAMPAVARQAVVRAIAARARAWRFVSAALRDELLASLDAPTRRRVERIAAIEAPPLDLPDVAEAVARLRGELAGKRVAVSVGRLVPGKRVERAIEYVRSRADLDILYVIGDGPERRRLEAWAERGGAQVRFLGMVSRRDALAWIGAADLLIHASEAEGLSTVLREAEALGTPVEVLAGVS